MHFVSDFPVSLSLSVFLSVFLVQSYPCDWLHVYIQILHTGNTCLIKNEEAFENGEDKPECILSARSCETDTLASAKFPSEISIS